MSKCQDSSSPSIGSISEHYAPGYEAGRLQTGPGRIECARSRELLNRFLPAPPARILDIGGGPGGHACWLARQGFEIHLMDLVPLHVEQAVEASMRQPEAPLASASIGDACALFWADNTADAVLLFGPLYHLTDHRDRLKALKEAYRVLKCGGVLLAAGISRFASVLDGLLEGYLKDPEFVKITEQDLATGHHQNPTGKPEYFMDTFFHHPEELKTEVLEAGFLGAEIYGVEGPSWLTPGLDDWWKDESRRQLLLHLARLLEKEPSLLGISAHLMAVAFKKPSLNPQFEMVVKDKEAPQEHP